jgi:hypothetical protein
MTISFHIPPISSFTIVLPLTKHRTIFVFNSVPFSSIPWYLMLQLMPSVRQAVNLLHHPELEKLKGVKSAEERWVRSVGSGNSEQLSDTTVAKLFCFTGWWKQSTVFSVEQSPWESNSRSVGQTISRPL